MVPSADDILLLGDYYMDKKHGHGVYTWADGRKYDGMWQNGKQHGEGTYYDAHGVAKKGAWEGGKRIRWLNESDNAPQQTDEKPVD